MRRETRNEKAVRVVSSKLTKETRPPSHFMEGRRWKESTRSSAGAARDLALHVFSHAASDQIHSIEQGGIHQGLQQEAAIRGVE